jgi:hypothetical protein
MKRGTFVGSCLVSPTTATTTTTTTTITTTTTTQHNNNNPTPSIKGEKGETVTAHRQLLPHTPSANVPPTIPNVVKGGERRRRSKPRC